jgi:hypothetical protein
VGVEPKETFLFWIDDFFVSYLKASEGFSDLYDVVKKIYVFSVLFDISLEDDDEYVEDGDIVIESEEGVQEVKWAEVEHEVE